MRLKIDRKCPFYTDSQSYAYHSGEKNLYVESQIVNAECILFMDQAMNMDISKMNEFAESVITEYGVRRPTALLSRYVLEHTDDKSLVDEARKFLHADSNIRVRMASDAKKVFKLVGSILKQAENELQEFRLFDQSDCEPFEGEKSLGRILVMSVDGIPGDIRTQDSQLALVTPELLEKPLYEMNFITGGSCSSCEDLSSKIIGVLKKELVPERIRNILDKKNPIQAEATLDRPPLDIDKKAPLYLHPVPSLSLLPAAERYLESTAANISCLMEIESVPENEPEVITCFAERLNEEYGQERPLYLLSQYFKDYKALNGFGTDQSLTNTDLILPNLGHYPDGRLNVLYTVLKYLSEDLGEYQENDIGMTMN